MTWHLPKPLVRLGRDQSAVIFIEFAFVLPIFMLLGLTSIELTNLAITKMRVSQISMTVADNLSRAMQGVGLDQPQLREVDINDSLLGARIQGGDTLKILEGGRIIVSSLQANGTGRQTIAWQRCAGTYQTTGLYGAEGATQPSTGTGGFQGMGTGATRVRAEPNTAVIFAEVAYKYQPLVSERIFGTPVIRSEAAFYVRDDRDLTTVQNPKPAAKPSRCNEFDTTF